MEATGTADERLIELACGTREVWIRRQVPMAEWWAIPQRGSGPEWDAMVEEIGGRAEPFSDRLFELWDEMEHLMPTTIEGASAKAALVVMAICHERENRDGLQLDKMGGASASRPRCAARRRHRFGERFRCQPAKLPHRTIVEADIQH